jgi:hypothetical protein
MSSALQRRLDKLEATADFKGESNRLKIETVPNITGQHIWWYVTGCLGRALGVPVRVGGG